MFLPGLMPKEFPGLRQVKTFLWDGEVTMKPKLLKRRKKHPNETHGLSKTRSYSSWIALKRRCLDPEYKEYHYYGGRGITVCERWLKFENFFADMGERPENHFIDRVDNDKGYEPDNCRWLPIPESNKNRRCVRIFTAGGESLTVKEWAKKFKVSIGTINTRLTNGESFDHIYETFKDELGNRNVRLLTFNDETLSVASWSRKIGLPTHVII